MSRNLLYGLFIPLFCCTFRSEANAGGWTLEEGSLRMKSYFSYTNTTERFASKNLICGGTVCENGERSPFFFNGEYTSYATFLGARYGITDRLEVRVLVPYYHVRFTDQGNPDRPPTKDIGDILFSGRYQLTDGRFAYSFRTQAKAPTGFFTKDAEVVPVGDGQWDLSLTNQFSFSLWPVPAYLSLDAGYRFRFRPPLERSNKAPGNEIIFRFEGGYDLTERFLLKGSVNGIIGREGELILSEDQVLINRDSDRRIVYAEPGIYWKKGKWAVEASVKFPLAGKNFPAGKVFGGGLMYTLGNEKSPERKD